MKYYKKFDRANTSPCHSPYFFSIVPPILVVLPESTTPNSFHTQDPSIGINDQIV
jgi:hypothetical protein